MGNEGSIPANEEEFESQARAPPSASLPPTNNSSQQPQQQTSARGGRMINAVFHRRQQQNVAVVHPPGAPPMQPEDMVMMSPEEQQQYYQEQQLLYMQQQQQQHPQQSQQQQQQQYYNNNNNGYTNGDFTSASGTATTPKKGIGFRPSGRAGAAIINSMKNLSLGSSVLGRSGNNTASPSKGTRTTSKDWETKWDEDDDSDGEEEQNATKPPAPQHQAVSPQRPPPQNVQNLAHAQQHHVALTMPPMIRPGMDIGLSCPSPDVPTTVAQKVHLVTATPEQGVEDGVEWDTGAIPSESSDYDKPNVQMFLPLLRVLGKGSFGKVKKDLANGLSSFMPLPTDLTF